MIVGPDKDGPGTFEHHKRTYPDPRPPCPPGEDVIWYRGWEAGYDGSGSYAAVMGDGRYVAYRGGCDLGAREVTASTWNALLDEIDAEEDV